MWPSAEEGVLLIEQLLPGRPCRAELLAGAPPLREEIHSLVTAGPALRLELPDGPEAPSDQESVSRLGFPLAGARGWSRPWLSFRMPRQTSRLYLKRNVERGLD